MPTFLEVLQGMVTHLDGTIAGTVELVPTPDTALSNADPPYATVAPGDEGEGVNTQNGRRHPKAGQLFITTWVKEYEESEAENTTKLLLQSDLLVKRAISATVGQLFSVRRIGPPQKVDNQDGVLLYRTAEVTFYWRED